MARDFIKVDHTQSAATQAPALKDYINTLTRAIQPREQVFSLAIM